MWLVPFFVLCMCLILCVCVAVVVMVVVCLFCLLLCSGCLRFLIYVYVADFMRVSMCLCWVFMRVCVLLVVVVLVVLCCFVAAAFLC